MKVLVLSGSPKGEPSVTVQYAEYLRAKFPQHEFRIEHVAHTMNKIERDASLFDEVTAEAAQSDFILWAFPLYVCTVHGSYHRFVELIWERGAQDCFRGKYAASFSTSINFFDHTAHNYMHAVCDDLGMRYVGQYSAKMDDLMKPAERERLERFAANAFTMAMNQAPTARLYAPVAEASAEEYHPAPAAQPVDSTGLSVLLITDAREGDTNLMRMAEKLAGSYSGPVETVNLNAIRMKGGCLGCLRCGCDNNCVYGDSDDVKAIYNEKIQRADIILFACRISQRNFSARMKTFIDRRFMNTHQPTMVGKQVAYVLAGSLSDSQNLYEVIQVIAQLDRANLTGVIDDVGKSSTELDEQLAHLAAQTVALAKAGYVQPQTFLGVGGAKLFRDEIWGQLRFTFRGDHLYYKKHGYYDFPQKNSKMRVMNAVMMTLNKLPGFRSHVQQNMKEMIITDQRKQVAAAQKG